MFPFVVSQSSVQITTYYSLDLLWGDYRDNVDLSCNQDMIGK